MEEFHDRLRKARLRKYETASDAARALNMKVQTYLAHENGNRGGQDDAQRYARAFGVDYRWLMTGKGSPTGDPIQSLLDDLPAEARQEAETFVRYLHQRHVKQS